MVQEPSWMDDIEREVAAFQSEMTPLAKILSRLTNRSIDRLEADIGAMMERGRYKDIPAAVFLNGQADAYTVKRLTELLDDVPERMRPKLFKAVSEQIAWHRMTNRSAIRTLARLNCYSVLDDMLGSCARILAATAEKGYLRGTFILQKEAGAAWNVDGMGARTQIVVDSLFKMSDAKRFMDPVADMSSKTVINAMLRGLPPDQVAESVDDIKGSMVYRSKREARTTLTAASQAGHHEAYVAHGVSEYYFRCTYDERTCEICGLLDGKRFKVYSAKEGYNYPPMHPNCRCTTVAVYDDEAESLIAPRFVKDRTTGEKHTVRQDYTYAEWYRTYGPGRTDGIAYTPKKRSKR